VPVFSFYLSFVVIFYVIVIIKKDCNELNNNDGANNLNNYVYDNNVINIIIHIFYRNRSDKKKN